MFKRASVTDTHTHVTVAHLCYTWNYNDLAELVLLYQWDPSHRGQRRSGLCDYSTVNPAEVELPECESVCSFTCLCAASARSVGWERLVRSTASGGWSDGWPLDSSVERGSWSVPHRHSEDQNTEHKLMNEWGGLPTIETSAMLLELF